MSTDDTFLGKFLPVQPDLSLYFKGDQSALIAALYYATLDYSNAASPLREFSIECPPAFPPESNMSNVALLQFLRFIVLLTQPRRVLEIGTFLGISAMCLATKLPPDGKVVTIETFDLFAGCARRNVDANKLSARIEILQGDAYEIVSRGLPDPSYDLIFLDGNKERYADYFRLLDPLLRAGGVLVVDDIFFQGDALNAEPLTDKGRGTLAFLEAARAHPGYFKTILPIGDGVMLLFKVQAT